MPGMPQPCVLARLANHLDSLIILADMQYVVVLEMKAFNGFQKPRYSCCPTTAPATDTPPPSVPSTVPLHLELTDELH